MAVSVEVSATPDGPSLELGKPVALFDLRVSGPNGEPEVYVAGSNSGVGYDVLPDGRFVMARYPDLSSSREIVLVRNWLSELKPENAATEIHIGLNWIEEFETLAARRDGFATLERRFLDAPHLMLLALSFRVELSLKSIVRSTVPARSRASQSLPARALET